MKIPSLVKGEFNKHLERQKTGPEDIVAGVALVLVDLCSGPVFCLSKCLLNSPFTNDGIFIHLVFILENYYYLVGLY